MKQKSLEDEAFDGSLNWVDLNSKCHNSFEIVYIAKLVI